jgi:hypothetical protein
MSAATFGPHRVRRGGLGQDCALGSGASQYRRQVPGEVPDPSLYGANFRLGGLMQWGGYDQGNGTNGLYQGQAGADFNLFQ